MEAIAQKKRIRLALAIFIFGLVISGLTAVALPAGVDILHNIFGTGTSRANSWPSLSRWIDFIYQGVHDINERYPFIFYGTDWLAFGHIVIAIVFLGPLLDPLKNVWVIKFGIIACVLVIPWTLIFGPIRGIPFFWQVLDASFGVLGLVPLLLAYRLTRSLADTKVGV